MNAHGLHLWEQDPMMESAVLPHNGCVWGNTPTPPHALQAVLLHKRRQFGAHVPATPYGPFVFVPAQADLSRVEGVEEWWHTDGISVWRQGGPKLTGAEAADEVKASFEKAADRLPFRPVGDDVFFHSIRIQDGHYRIFAIDPGWIDPAERHLDIQVQLPGAWQLTDVLSGQGVPLDGGRAPMVVPAGALRIIDARQEGP
jgi:hypothetical protein